MEFGIIISGSTGAIAGIVHLLIGPDHLAAVAPFTADQRRNYWMTGLQWGIGHTGSVWLIGILVFLSREILPLERLSHWSERLIGIVLIGLGIWGMKKAMSSHVHFHPHEHGGSRHAHFHVHNKQTARDHASRHTHRHTHAPMGIGILHGLAGSSHLFGILPALALPTQSEAVAYIGGFGIGVIIAITAFSWILGRLMQQLTRWSSKAYQRAQVSFSSAAIGVGIFWLTTGG